MSLTTSTCTDYQSKSSDGYCKNKLRVCSNKNQGMRKYMEDEVKIVIEEEDKRTAFLGVFDGHGGKEASIFARDNLYANIKAQPDFSDSNPEKVKSAIREGFLKTHWDMFRIVDTWPKRKDGLNSTSGTTATIAIIRGNKLYIAHVGDSAAVIATKNDDSEVYCSKDLTKDHKPESLEEKSRIEALGGRVASTNGVPRVVWKRAVQNAPLTNGTSKQYEYVPFLAVSRALGDLWSYDFDKSEFIVSPEPEIQAIDIIPGYHKFIVIASDGLWGVMNGNQAVDIVKSFETSSTCEHSKRNSSQHLVNKSLSLWQRKRSRADNISAVVAFFDSELEACAPGPTTEEEADTDALVSDNDDTPPMSKENSSSSLVRQLAFHNPADFNKPPVSLKPVIDEKPEKNFNTTEDSTTSITDVNNQGKRKIGDSTNEESNQKKLRTASPVASVSEDSHQCNVITVLSPESLYELQLDEDLGFADDESDENQAKNRRSEPTMVTRSSLLVK